MQYFNRVNSVFQKESDVVDTNVRGTITTLQNSKNGFTLIELAIVIAIVGMLATVTFVSVNGVRRSGRDARRLADIKQIQTAIQSYYAAHNKYPVAPTDTDCTAISTTANGLGNTNCSVLSDAGFTSFASSSGVTYMAQVPSNPQPNGNLGGYQYKRQDSTGAANIDAYEIAFELEGNSGGFNAGSHVAIADSIRPGTMTVTAAGTWTDFAQDTIYGPSVNSTGNVGIGFTSTSTTPSSRLEVQGSAATNPLVTFKATGGSGANKIFRLLDSTSVELMTAQYDGKVGIGDTTPASLFTVGFGDLFQVDSAGDLIKIKNLTYSWPTAHAPSTVLTNNGSGGLSWAAAASSGITSLGGLTGATQTFGNDTNVTITSSGTAHTLGWSGSLGVARGGTGTSTAFTTGSIVFAGASGVYTQKNANFFWDNTNNRLGIGTTTPSSALSVGASNEFQVNSTGNIIKINNITTSFPSVQGAASTILTNDGAGILSWAAAGGGSQTPWTSAINAAGYTLNGNNTASGNLTLDSTSNATKGYVLINPTGGNVGIGALSPAAALDIDRTPGSYGQVIVGTSAVGGAGKIAFRRSGGGVGGDVGYNIASEDNTVNLSSNIATGRVALRVNNAEIAFVDSSSFVVPSGKVGIGDTTPDGLLDVESTGAVTVANYGINLSNLTTNTTTDGINKYGIYTTSTGTWTGSTGTVTNNYGLYIDTISGADNNFGAYILGNVGIGALSPAAALDIDRTPGSYGQVIVGTSAVGGAGKIAFRRSGGGVGGDVGYNIASEDNTVNLSSNIATGRVALRVNNAEIAFVDSSSFRVNNRVLQAKGVDVASAGTITLGNGGNYFQVTGVMSLDFITTTGWTSGSVIMLKFSGALTVNDRTATPPANTAPIDIGAAYTTTANDTLTLVYDAVDGFWYEIARSVN